MKAWAEGQPEPSGWQFGAADSEGSLQGAGAAGLGSSPASNAPVLFGFDGYRVGSAVEVIACREK